MAAEFIQVLTAAGSRNEAERISQRLVGDRLAACVQVVGPVASRYWWEGQVEEAQEWLCIAKALRSRFDAVAAAVREEHSYDLPEITAVPVVEGSAEYLAWVAESTTAG